MELSPTGSTGGSSGTQSLTQTISSTNQLNQQQFLQLLITQLTNQDPLNPQDQSQFLGEMAQFSTVTGIDSLNSSMGQFQGAALLGKTVDANSGAGTVTGVVQSVAFSTNGVMLTLNDSNNSVVNISNVLDVHN